MFSGLNQQWRGVGSMSCDFGVWYPARRFSDEEAGAFYASLCSGDASGIEAHPALDAFYNELTGLHPELDTVPDDRVDDHAYCPWSCALDRSPGHVIMACVWSQAENVEKLVKELAQKHGLAMFNPQSGHLSFPDQTQP